ncbi:MAG: major capsid protein, partial [Chloroherpetonaceae bacterium]
LEKAVDETKSRADDSPIDFGNVQVAGFVRGGVKFVQYPGGVGNTDFIGTNDIHYVPLLNGIPVPGLFEIYYAPADYAETVNTLGLPFYAKAELLQYGKGFALNAQSNPMPICTRPKTLIKTTLP